jgi:MoaA/NifB/PqqE/SkfB family radical SAM enzyme
MTDESRLRIKQENLTNKLFKEKTGLPSRYVYILTNLCNLNCDFCFLDRKPLGNRMNLEDWKKLTDQLPEYARITIGGGEPLIFPKFEETFDYVANRFDCTMITNGTMLTEKKSNFLLKYPKFDVLSISIEDIGNKLRSFNDEEWNNLKKQIKYFVQRKKELESSCLLDIKTTVLDENADKLFDLHKYCFEELGCDTQVFQFLKGSPIQHADRAYEIKDLLAPCKAPTYKKFQIICEQLEKVKEYSQANHTRVFLHPKVDVFSSKNKLNLNQINKENHNTSLYAECKYIWSSVHINSDGQIFPCLAYSVGNIKKNSLIEIINGEKMKEFRKLIQDYKTLEACNGCGYLRLKEERFKV